MSAPPKGGRAAFIIWAPDYTYLSSGIRCLFLLCHHLNRMGYEAYITGRNAPSHLSTRFIDIGAADRFRANGGHDITIYPEIVKENYFLSKNVVRYLLNKPGFLTDTTVAHYGADEYFIHYADEFVPEGVRSRRLRIPTLDTTVFNMQDSDVKREGFLLYSSHNQADVSAIPDWIYPRTIISRDSPIDPVTLARLYRSSRGFVTWERTAAATEAMHCGCPVILMPNAKFEHEHIVRRNLGCGVAVGCDSRSLAIAARSLPIGRYWYHLRSVLFVQSINRFAKHAQRHFGYQS